MSNLLNITPDRVQISNLFDTNRQYLYKDTTIVTSGEPITWESWSQRYNISIEEGQLLADELYLNNSEIARFNNQIYYGLFRQPDTSGLAYWHSRWISLNRNTPSLKLEFALGSLADTAIDGPRVQTNNKSFLSTNDVSPFYDGAAAEESVFTKILNTSGLQVYQETSENLQRSIEYDRFQYGPANPTRGPFFENYFTNDPYYRYELFTFVNILLVDKPPVKTGFFKFFIGEFSFNGFITRQTPYPHFDWERVSGASYDYVFKSSNLGYGIEISRNSLYTTRWVETGFGDSSEGYWELIPTPLLTFLRSLRGGEEIISTGTPDSPETFITDVEGLIIPDNLPIDLSVMSEGEALRYIASYPDLITAFGTDYKAGINHYNRTGFREGRKISFNPIAYINKYTDIKQAFGYDTLLATKHYINFGYAQGRVLDNASSLPNFSGGLYDERFGILPYTNSSIVWPNGSTLSAKGKVLTYKLGTAAYFLNGNLPIDNKLVFLKVQ